jgi:adenosylmethionine-8-amino-7-oxononanoate aminotransferase
MLTRAFAEENLVLRVSGDTVALAPALIVSETEIARMVEGIRAVLERLD